MQFMGALLYCGAVTVLKPRERNVSICILAQLPAGYFSIPLNHVNHLPLNHYLAVQAFGGMRFGARQWEFREAMFSR